MTENEAERLNAYKKLMKEIRRRVEAIEAIVNQETGLEARFAREAAYLQLRMACETVALGCVIAHAGFSDLQAAKLQKEYAADKIMGVLSGLHDRFYPQPISVLQKEAGRVSIEDGSIEHLSKEDLKALYRKCGQALHRGTPAAIISGEKIEKDWISFVMRQTQLLLNLLASHVIVMRGDQRAIFCNFVAGEVWVANAINH
ncbi:hypothetical protein [Brucella anthropi]|uniref:hypothetical protein n=1 Tax=Brucella anthropi TaxID=529 RepID=UPI0005B82FEC|nr:hypothetical protein [Brucella anthropi]KIU68528.1 hypothetical protein TR92_11815 [Brucella anthropi]